MNASILKRHFYWLSFLLLLSCGDGLEDIFVDNYPELEEMQITASPVAPFDTVLASIVAKNPIDGPLEYQWSVIHDESENDASNRIIGTIDTDSILWIASIEGGTYEIKVRVSNSKRSSSTSKQVQVITSEVPLVQILSPDPDTYYVIGQVFNVSARAEHANGLSSVSLFAGDSLIQQFDQNSSGVYQFVCTADSSMVGTTALKVEARTIYIAQPPGSDWINIEVGGIILGKNGK